MPTWLIVENASSRLMCRCVKHMIAPTTVVTAPSERKMRADVRSKRPQRRLEDSPVNAKDAEDSELHHHAGEEDADRRRRDGMRIGQPEMKRHDRGFDEEAARDQDKRNHDERSAGAPASAR